MLGISGRARILFAEDTNKELSSAFSTGRLPVNITEEESPSQSPVDAVKKAELTVLMKSSINEKTSNAIESSSLTSQWHETKLKAANQ